MYALSRARGGLGGLGIDDCLCLESHQCSCLHRAGNAKITIIRQLCEGVCIVCIVDIVDIDVEWGISYGE